jgi:hypothetical protein
MKVSDLIPGDVLEHEGDHSLFVFVSKTDHPLFPNMQMVIWWQWNRGYVLDALSIHQELPFTSLSRYPDKADKDQVLRMALLTWQQSGMSLRPPS